MIKINDKAIKITNFPDGTQKIDLPELGYQYCVGHVNIEWNYENDTELFTLYSVTRKIQNDLSDFNKGINLIMPYIPNARMDRVKHDYEIFTLKYFCEIINSLNFRNVYVLDAHSDVSLALLNNVKPMNVYTFIANTVNDIEQNYENIDLVMFTPDAGAHKRYGDMLKDLSDYPCGFAVKKRDWETGKILGLTLEDNGVDLKGKDVLIVDDICSKGGTFYHTAKALKEAGVNRIFLYASHCEDTILKGELLKDNDLIEKIYTTNSIYTIEHEKIITWNI